VTHPINLWRVADRTPVSPAHLISRTAIDGLRVMGCGWLPTKPGLVITQLEMLTGHRYACVACMRYATGRVSGPMAAAG
jgi:hypothetical protein